MQKRTNFMVDGETLAVSPNSVIRCLSIAPFTLEREESIDEILSRTLTVWISGDAQVEMGREIDDDTVDFWEKEKAKYREGSDSYNNAHSILYGHEEDQAPKDALEVLSAYITDVNPDGLIFSRGSNFDFPMIETLFKQSGLLLPYSTWKVACSKSIIRFLCEDNKDTEANLVNGLKSNHTSSYDVAVEIKKLQAIHAVLRDDQ